MNFHFELVAEKRAAISQLCEWSTGSLVRISSLATYGLDLISELVMQEAGKIAACLFHNVQEKDIDSSIDPILGYSVGTR